MSWTPISKKELRLKIADQLGELDPNELAVFRKIQVALREVPIDRFGVIGVVYVVAKFNDVIVFYEDAEEGFEITKLDASGVIKNYGSSQFTLRQVIHQLNKYDQDD